MEGNQTLVMAAESVLKQVPARNWDSVGWNLYNTIGSPANAPPEEVLEVWKACIDCRHRTFNQKYREYARAGGIHANYSSEEAAAYDKKKSSEELKPWNATLPIAQIERIGQAVKIFLDSGRVIETSAEALFSQSMFRRDVFIGITVILPTIKNLAFNNFLAQFQVFEVEAVGSSLREKIEETLEIQREKLSGMEVEDSEIIETLKARGFALTKDALYFRFSYLQAELRKDELGLKQSTIFSTFRDMDLEHVNTNKFNYWKYAYLGSDNPQIPF